MYLCDLKHVRPFISPFVSLSFYFLSFTAVIVTYSDVLCLAEFGDLLPQQGKLQSLITDIYLYPTW